MIMLKNNKCKYVNYPKIGTIRFEKSRKAKRVVISIKSPTNIRVAVPTHVSIRKAETFVSHKLDWIQKHLNGIQNKTNALDVINSISFNQKNQIIERVHSLANQYNFKINKISLRKMTTRWGSCSPQNNISLNIGLIALPERLRDYIILHELVHTKIKNHSSKFWNELERIIPNSKSFSKELKRNYDLYEV